MRIGHGYDAHALAEDRKLILGGVHIQHSKGLNGHSDADVLVHAVMDSILGAAGLGDIGRHFPDTSDKYKGISSILLLREVRNLLSEAGYSVGNIDCTVIAQEPRLRPYIEQMRENIANALDIDKDRINVKATTEEKMGFTGRVEGMSAHAVCLIMQDQKI